MMIFREAVEMSGIRMVVGLLLEEQGMEERMERSQGEKRRRVEEEVVMEEVEVTEDLRHNIINMYRYVDEHKWTRI